MELFHLGIELKKWNQEEIIYAYLYRHCATASMVELATGIPQKNICRYKRKLQKAGLLWEVMKSTCRYTNHEAWYLTTNQTLLDCSQLSLFKAQL